MALKAEGAALDSFEVMLKCEEGEDKEEAMVVAVILRPKPMLRVAQQKKTSLPRPSLLEAGSDGCEELKQQMSDGEQPKRQWAGAVHGIWGQDLDRLSRHGTRTSWSSIVTSWTRALLRRKTSWKPGARGWPFCKTSEMRSHPLSTQTQFICPCKP